ncbi:MAG TPA: DNA polymerase, partial [Pirellulaceae bacterium]|nr:DNA polymerase [Pirellulaceae bacterium]
EHPQLGIGSGYNVDDVFENTDHAGLLWDILRQPQSRPATRHSPEVLHEAAEHVSQMSDDERYEQPVSFNAACFAEWLIRQGLPWPRTEKGQLSLSDDSFRQMARQHPEVAPLRELRHSLGEMRLFSDLAVGSDGRNRCLLSPFRSITGRNQPSNAKFIFGPSCWLRGLIKPEPGRAVAYVDWSQQEFGIAGAMSGDGAMMEAYSSGDPYLTFAKQAGVVPANATKESHPAERDQFKVCALAVQYGMGSKSLAESLGQSEAHSRRLLKIHRETYPTFWSWSDSAVNHAMLQGWLSTVFGWTLRVGGRVNPRSLANFPSQANGAEMLRLACCLATERGIRVCAPIHDALLVEGKADEIDDVVDQTQKAMAEASRIILDGFELRSDSSVVTYPDRYMDPRGEQMWASVMAILDGIVEASNVPF